MAAAALLVASPPPHIYVQPDLPDRAVAGVVALAVAWYAVWRCTYLLDRHRRSS